MLLSPHRYAVPPARTPPIVANASVMQRAVGLWVVAPADQRAVRLHTARVEVAGCHAGPHRGADARRQRLRCGRPEAQIAVGRLAEAEQVAAGRVAQPARHGADADLGPVLIGADRRGLVHDRAADRIDAPARQAAVVVDAAHAVAPDAERLPADARLVGHDHRRRWLDELLAVAEGTVRRAGTPAPQRVVAAQAARLDQPRADGDPVGGGADRLGPRVRYERAVAELAEGITAPAVHRTVAADAAREATCDRDLLERRWCAVRLPIAGEALIARARE